MNETGKPILVISNDLAQYVIKHVQFNAELIGKKRRFGLNVYFNKGLSDTRNAATYLRKETTINPVVDGNGFYKSYYFGADAKFYPEIEAKKLKYFYTFGLETGETSCRIESETSHTYMPGFWSGNTYYYYYILTTTTKSVNFYENRFWGFHHKEGCLWTITDRIYLEAELNIGMNHFIEPDKDSDGKNYHSYAIKYGAGLHLGIAL